MCQMDMYRETTEERLRRYLAEAQKDLMLVCEAARDVSLSDATVRMVALGVQPPTADDITWAGKVIDELVP